MNQVVDRPYTRVGARGCLIANTFLPPVSFRPCLLQYATSNEPVLHGLTFHVPPHTRVGIVGRTGAGKSSLMNALFR